MVTTTVILLTIHFLVRIILGYLDVGKQVSTLLSFVEMVTIGVVFQRLLQMKLLTELFAGLVAAGTVIVVYYPRFRSA